jgi:hypothetical protein
MIALFSYFGPFFPPQAHCGCGHVMVIIIFFSLKCHHFILFYFILFNFPVVLPNLGAPSPSLHLFFIFQD